jgi:regulator of replication initiation timing
MPKPGHAVDVDALDRLEEKVKQLVALVGRQRAEQARMAEELQRVTRELEAARARLQEFDGTAAEITSLVKERDVIRARVSSLLEQIEGLNL